MRKIILKLLIILLVISFCDFCQADSKKDLQVYLLNGQFDKLIKIAQDMISKKTATDQAYYYLGLANLKKKNYIQARENFKAALNLNSDPNSKDKIELALADSFFLETKYSEALPIYEEVLKNTQSEGLQPILLLRIAQCNIKQGKWKEGRDSLDKLRANYPNSLELLISEPLSSSDEFFCIQAGSFTNQDNAQKFVDELKSKGFDARLTTVSSNNTTLYRVRVGEYQTRQEAEEVKERLEKLGYDTKIYP